MNNWYKIAKELDNKELDNKELKDIVDYLIRQTWALLDKNSKYNSEQVIVVIENVQSLYEFAMQYGEKNYEKILSEVEKELLKREEAIFKAKATKLSNNSLLEPLIKAIKGSTWEEAKNILLKYTPCINSYDNLSLLDRDEIVENAFKVIFNALFQSNYNINDIISNSPYTKNNNKYIKRLSELNNDNLSTTELIFKKHIFGNEIPSQIEVFRGVPDARADLRPGDYVTLNRNYARSYIRGKHGKIIRQLLTYSP